MLYNNYDREDTRRSNDPRPIGAILTEMLHSDSPLAKGYRKFLASEESNAEKGDQNNE